MYKDIDPIVWVHESGHLTRAVEMNKLKKLSLSDVKLKDRIDAEADLIFYPYNFPILYAILKKCGLSLIITKPYYAEVKDWLKSNLPAGDYKFTEYLGLEQDETIITSYYSSSDSEYATVHYPSFILFKRKEDVLAFKLRWGFHD